jgi:DNA-binding response OmpR family regulator
MTNKKIFIVDDDLDTQFLLKKRLSHHGYQCVTFSNVEAALKELRQVNPSLVILDLGFPDVNGTAFLQSAKKWLPDDATVPPVIVLSGYNEKEISDYVLESGAVEFLSKPCNMNTLISKVENYIGA